MAFQFKFTPGCCCDQCTPCLNSNFPDEIEVEIASLANDDCTECINANGTWTLTQAVEPFSAAGNCQVHYDGFFENVTGCPYAGGTSPFWISIQLKIFFYPDTGFRRVIVGVYTTHIAGVHNILLDEFVFEEQADPFDCTDFGALNVPHESPGVGNDLCDKTAATCTLSP